MNLVLLEFTEFYRFLLVFPRFYWTLQGFTGFYWVLLFFLLSFTGFETATLVFYRVLLVFPSLIKFHWLALDVTGFYWVLLGFYWRLSNHLKGIPRDFPKFDPVLPSFPKIH